MFESRVGEGRRWSIANEFSLTGSFCKCSHWPELGWGRSQEQGSHSRSHRWVQAPSYLLPPGSALAGKLSQEPESGIEPRHSNVGCRRFIARLNAIQKNSEFNSILIFWNFFDFLANWNFFLYERLTELFNNHLASLGIFIFFFLFSS